MILEYPQVVENKSLHMFSYSKLNEKASEKGEMDNNQI